LKACGSLNILSMPLARDLDHLGARLGHAVYVSFSNAAAPLTVSTRFGIRSARRW
jgi:hypothetical protein